MLNASLNWRELTFHCDSVPLTVIAENCGTPVYVYSLRRAVENLRRIQRAFSALDAHVHYSLKANANLAVIQALNRAGAGADAVSGGEIYRALLAGVQPMDIVFAGVGKTAAELSYALEHNIGWFNVENVEECRLLDDLAASSGRTEIRVALRLNPDVAASTHPHIATGHAGAKFGLPAEAIRHILNHQGDYPHLHFAGIHIHIGSQLHDLTATKAAVTSALEVVSSYPTIKTVNIGGGFPVPYSPTEIVPSIEDFAAALKPMLEGYTVLLEPGRWIIADAGVLVIKVLYVKLQADETFVITDGSMSDLIRPALYGAHHEIIPVKQPLNEARFSVHVVGPVCETADVLGLSIPLPQVRPGDLLAVLTAGAYGMVMASNYNQRPRAPEVVVDEDGISWRIARRRETWEDLVRCEVP